MDLVYYAPSFYAHILSGLFLLIALILIMRNYSSTLIKLDAYKMLLLVLVLSIAGGVHSISHMGLEKVYGYNPFYFLG